MLTNIYATNNIAVHNVQPNISKTNSYLLYIDFNLDIFYSNLINKSDVYVL